HIKFNKFTIFILLICSILFLFWKPVFADPVPIGLAGASSPLVYLIIYLITYPLVQFIVLETLYFNLLMDFQYPYPFFIPLVTILGILIVELIAIGIEYFIISSILSRFYDNDKIKYPINKKSIFYYVTLANIASFALGNIAWTFLNPLFSGGYFF
ncbi:MAG: hypothetical protein P8Y70_16965, partial [Candidatus Lokiarchaeota archaeon]